MIEIFKIDANKFCKEKICLKILLAMILIIAQFLFQNYVSSVKKDHLLSKKNLYNIEDALQKKVYNLVYMRHSLQDLDPENDLFPFESDILLNKYIVKNLNKSELYDSSVEKIKVDGKVVVYHVESRGTYKQLMDFFIALRESGLIIRVTNVAITNIAYGNMDISFDAEAKIK